MTIDNGEPGSAWLAVFFWNPIQRRARLAWASRFRLGSGLVLPVS
jgi:hypothetical protein